MNGKQQYTNLVSCSICSNYYLHEVFDVDSPALLVEAGCGKTMGKDDVAASDHFVFTALEKK